MWLLPRAKMPACLPACTCCCLDILLPALLHMPCDMARSAELPQRTGLLNLFYRIAVCTLQAEHICLDNHILNCSNLLNEVAYQASSGFKYHRTCSASATAAMAFVTAPVFPPCVRTSALVVWRGLLLLMPPCLLPCHQQNVRRQCSEVWDAMERFIEQPAAGELLMVQVNSGFCGLQMLCCCVCCAGLSAHS